MKSARDKLTLPAIDKRRMNSAVKARQEDKAIDFNLGNALLFPSLEKKNVDRNYHS